MKPLQLKEEARKEFDNLFLGGIFTTKERKQITKDFIDSLITKAYEDGKKEGEQKQVSIGINAFNPPSCEELGSMIINMMIGKNKRTVREEYVPGLFGDYLYLKVHQS